MPDPTDSSTTNGLGDSTIRRVMVDQQTFDYVFDASNRRRWKVWPSGQRDEYFFDTGSRMGHELVHAWLTIYDPNGPENEWLPKDFQRRIQRELEDIEGPVP